MDHFNCGKDRKKINDKKDKLEQEILKKIEGKPVEEQEIIKKMGKYDNELTDLKGEFNSFLNNVKESNIEKIAKSVYKYIGMDINEFETDRLEDIKATVFMPKNNTQRVNGVIVGDDSSHLTCGSIHPLEYYIEEFKNGKRDFKEDNENNKEDLNEEKIKFIRQAKMNNLNEWIEFLNNNQPDPMWKASNGLFLHRIFISLFTLQYIPNNEIELKQIELLKSIDDNIEKENRENVKNYVNQLKDLELKNTVKEENEIAVKPNNLNKKNLFKRIIDKFNKREQLK